MTRSFLVFLCCCIAVQCATRGRITGGPRDQTAPVLDAEASTPNMQTRFEKQAITLTFDEWIQLKDPINQILVSPPPEKRIDTRIKGKSIIFEFDEEEVLRENATYSINFGEAIQDLNESNAVKNFTFVFSTGDAIDSLAIRGSVIDALTGEPLENMTVMLYEDHRDSVVVDSKPFYASRTNEDGSFAISNLKSGVFKAVAIEDQNLDYTWSSGEQIAFPDTLINITADSSAQLNLVASQPKVQIQRDRPDTSSWNIAVLPFNRSPQNVEISSDLEDAQVVTAVENNTAWVYYAPDAGRFSLYLHEENVHWYDTLSLRGNPVMPKISLGKKNRWKNSYHPEEPIRFCVDRPLITIDTSRLILLQGNRPAFAEVEISDSISFCIELNADWQADSTYRLTLLPGALTSLGGVQNDTIADRFPIVGPERFGAIDFSFTGLNADYQYLFELIRDKNKSGLSFSVKDETSSRHRLERLKPGNYKLRIVEDINKNGQWDPGDYFSSSQPEAIQEITLEELRANWDLEVNHNWK